MTKKERKDIANILSIFILIGLCVFWYRYYDSNYYILVGILIAHPFIYGAILNLLPSKRMKKSTVKTNKTNKKKSALGKTSNSLRPDDVLLTLSLEELNWREFEQLCYLYYKAKGCKPRLTSEGADGGVDLIIYNKTHKTEEAIQIKHYIDSGNQITVKEIRELNSSKRNHGCVLAQFITTSSYTNPALAQADKFKIDCHDIRWVKSKIVKWQKEESMKRKLIRKA